MFYDENNSYYYSLSLLERLKFRRAAHDPGMMVSPQHEDMSSCFLSSKPMNVYLRKGGVYKKIGFSFTLLYFLLDSL